MPQVVDIDLNPAEPDEPTWEVLDPQTGRNRRRVNRRTKTILSAAAAAAVVVNAGAAWTYWQVRTGTGGGGGTVVEMQLRGRSDLNKQLVPGATGNLTITLTNDNTFPIRITSVVPGTAKVVADEEHRDAGCLNTGVSLTRGEFEVTWEVARNTIGAFTIPDGLQMATRSDRACAGATFTVPVQVSGSGD